MARTYNKASDSPMSFPVALNRMEARPLDASSFFATLAAARTYASSSANAYVGQILTVVEGSSVSLYIITDAAGTLLRLPTLTDLQEIASGLDNVGYQGSLTDLLSKDVITATRGQYFNVDEEGLQNMKNLLIGKKADPTFFDNVEVGDWLLVKDDFDLDTIGEEFNPGDYFNSWEKNIGPDDLHVDILQRTALSQAQITAALSNNGTSLQNLQILGMPIVTVNGIALPAANVSFQGNTLKFLNLQQDDIIPASDLVELSYLTPRS